MTYSDTQPRGTLRYRLLSASLVPSSSPLSEPGSWGHEYVRHLAAELGEEYSSRVEDEGDTPEEAAEKEKEKETEADKEKEVGEKKEKPVVKVVIEASNEELQALGMQCAIFLLGHNAEPDAVDLLEELEIVDRIAELVDENTYARVCAYMIR
jgi:26S proteasome regulatory subunit N1